ncbi:MAG: THUMP-like domain-containing protein [Actinomadura sp.]
MDIAAFQALLTPDGQALLAETAAADVSEAGLLATASRLRERHPAALVAAALTQVRLRVRARAKFGPDADRMYFTAAGLEQSTRASVAAHRAHRFRTDLHGARVLELCGGIGADLIALTRAGCRVEAVDLDPLTVAVARANLDALGLSGAATVRQGDATRTDPAGFAAVFADPGRRTERGRVFDPRAYEPPLATVLDLAGQAPAGCVKVAPGIPHEVIPDGVEAEWISDGGAVKEAALWLGRLASGGSAGAVARRATLLSQHRTHTLVPDPALGPPPVGPWRRYLYEPDGAVIRAHLVAEVAAGIDGVLADPRIAYITSDRLVASPFAGGYEIHDVLPFSLKGLRAELRRRDIGGVTIKKRGSAVDIERLRRDLRLSGTAQVTLVLTRVADAPIVLLCRPISAPTPATADNAKS